MGEEMFLDDRDSGEKGLELPPADEAVDTAAVMDDVRRACGELPSSVQGKIYADRLFQERYGVHVPDEPDRHDD